MKISTLFFFMMVGASAIYAQTETPEQLIDRQLKAYNDRDIDAFLATYSDDIKIYNHPNQLSMDGKEAMRKVYAGMFERTPDLHCEIVNRITIGDKIIDREHVTGFANGNTIDAVAIYEVKDGLILRVHFVR